jgi:nucleotide-binding universal stress UspA family protein
MPLAKYANIVAAVSSAKNEHGTYPSHTEKTLRFAYELTKHVKGRLRIVTVFEPTNAPPWGDVPVPRDLVATRAGVYHALRVGREEALKRLKIEIQELASRYPDVDAQGSVVEAWDPAQGIVSEAISRNANLIVVGTSRPSYRHVYRGFSTALSLMASSQLPVLVVPEEAELKWDDRDFRILIADDLKSDSVAVVRQGLSFAAALGPCKVEHLHVIENSPFTFFKLDGKLELQRACREEMKRRAKEFLQAITDIEYHPEVCFGDVAETLHDILEDRPMTLIVFGRHKTFKFQPFAIGRMTANAMLELKRPVLLVQQEFQ